jgi:hypothetical protein
MDATLKEVESVIERLTTEFDLVRSGGRGHKAAHKRMRKASNELTHLLVALRKESLVVSAGEVADE